MRWTLARPEDEPTALLWDAITFARNVGTAVGAASLEACLKGGPVAWATEHQIEPVGEAVNDLRKTAPSLRSAPPSLHGVITTRNILVH